MLFVDGRKGIAEHWGLHSVFQALLILGQLQLLLHLILLHLLEHALDLTLQVDSSFLVSAMGHQREVHPLSYLVLLHA